MRTFHLAALLTIGTLTAPGSAAPQAALTQALLGRWVGVLDYRDYREPPSSTKRVHLPTWLAITEEGQHLSLLYTYDDGPSKVLQEREDLTVDLAKGLYTVDAAAGVDQKVQSYKVSGSNELHDGRGTVVLTGPGTDNKQPAEIRTTWTIHRNLLSWLEEVRPAGSSAPFTFRHQYTFTRADPPAPTTPSPK